MSNYFSLVFEFFLTIIVEFELTNLNKCFIILVITINEVKKMISTSQNTNLKENILNNIYTWFYNQTTYSQMSLGKKLGVSQTTVARWLERKCLPDISLWPAICEIMDITIPQFLKLDSSSSMSNKESQLLNAYQNDLSFKSFIDKYLSDETFKQTINSLAAYTK